MRYSTLKLISAVEKYPCLWNYNDSGYRHAYETNLAWHQVCREVITDWETCDKEKKIANVKKKWSNLRNQYRKYLIKVNAAIASTEVGYAKVWTILRHNVRRVIQDNAADANNGQPKYAYSEVLAFLKPMYDRMRN